MGENNLDLRNLTGCYAQIDCDDLFRELKHRVEEEVNRIRNEDSRAFQRVYYKPKIIEGIHGRLHVNLAFPMTILEKKTHDRLVKYVEIEHDWQVVIVDFFEHPKKSDESERNRCRELTVYF